MRKQIEDYKLRKIEDTLRQIQNFMVEYGYTTSSLYNSVLKSREFCNNPVDVEKPSVEYTLYKSSK